MMSVSQRVQNLKKKKEMFLEFKSLAVVFYKDRACDWTIPESLNPYKTEPSSYALSDSDDSSEGPVSDSFLPECGDMTSLTWHDTSEAFVKHEVTIMQMLDAHEELGVSRSRLQQGLRTMELKELKELKDKLKLPKYSVLELIVLELMADQTNVGWVREFEKFFKFLLRLV